MYGSVLLKFSPFRVGLKDSPTGKPPWGISPLKTNALVVAFPGIFWICQTTCWVSFVFPWGGSHPASRASSFRRRSTACEGVLGEASHPKVLIRIDLLEKKKHDGSFVGSNCVLPSSSFRGTSKESHPVSLILRGSTIGQLSNVSHYLCYFLVQKRWPR